MLTHPKINFIDITTKFLAQRPPVCNQCNDKLVKFNNNYNSDYHQNRHQVDVDLIIVTLQTS